MIVPSTRVTDEILRRIHGNNNRMLVILPDVVHEAWLAGEAGKEILTAYPPDEMTAYPISTRVNSPRNNDPAIVEPT
jgi:putative SOS response-associated peptidase YedK